MAVYAQLQLKLGEWIAAQSVTKTNGRCRSLRWRPGSRRTEQIYARLRRKRKRDTNIFTKTNKQTAKVLAKHSSRP